jgi:hypothetical protein
VSPNQLAFGNFPSNGGQNFQAWKTQVTGTFARHGTTHVEVRPVTHARPNLSHYALGTLPQMGELMKHAVSVSFSPANEIFCFGNGLNRTGLAPFKFAWYI